MPYKAQNSTNTIAFVRVKKFRISLRAQAALEYMTTIGFALVILLGLSVFAYNYTISARQSGNVATASTTVSQIVEAANLVYAQGYPAKATITVQIPENVETITFSNRVIIMKLRVRGRTTDIAATAKSTLVGDLTTTRGFYKVSVQSYGNYVNVTHA